MEQNAIGRELVVRAFTPEQDYGMIQQWWEKHSSFAPHRDHLGKNGKIIEFDNKPICAGFLYNTDSSICIFEFPVSNPEADKEIRDVCLDRLIEEAKNWAKMNKYKLLYSPSNKNRLIARFINAGFIEVDNNMSHLFYEIGESHE